MSHAWRNESPGVENFQMDKRRKKEMRKRWREGQRAQIRAELPMPFDGIRAMFDMLDAELPRQGCDHTRRLTQRWLEDGGHDTEAVLAWLDDHGGYCDCEVLANVEQHFEEAMRNDQPFDSGATPLV
jgi:hypothetical protein